MRGNGTNTMLRATLFMTLLILTGTAITTIAAPTASASACNPNFPGAEVTCAVYDDVNQLCIKKFGHACFA